MSCFSWPQAIVVSSNGTTFDYVSTHNTENGPIGMDVHSIPQYKVDLTNEISGESDMTQNLLKIQLCGQNLSV